VRKSPIIFLDESEDSIYVGFDSKHNLDTSDKKISDHEADHNHETNLNINLPSKVNNILSSKTIPHSDHILISDKENALSPLDMEGLTLKKEESAESETIL